MITFKEFILLQEGGAITGAKGETADPISTKDRSSVHNDLKTSLTDLHDSFHKATGKHLFGKDAKAIKTGTAFSGSSAHLVNRKISDEELHHHKPTLGDIDTQVPKEHLADLHKHLTVGKKFGKYTVAGVKKGGNELHVLAKHENGQHHQIDFEGVEYHHDEPSKFETFAHSSNWEDTKHGIKGAAHKQLLNAAGGEHHKFSITHGLAARTDDKKAPAVHGEKDPKAISKKLFGHEHSIESFDDVARGVRTHIHHSEHAAIVKKFAERGDLHAVERFKGILSGKKIDESVNKIKIDAHKLAIDAIAKQIKYGTVDTKKALEKIAEYKNKIKNLISESIEETHHAAVTLPMGTSPSSHVGHQDLVDEMLRHAHPGHVHVSLSDKAEYLPHAQRKRIMEKQSPAGINVHVIHGAGESIRKAYDGLPEGKKVLHLVGGKERQPMLDGLKKSLEAGKVKEMEGHHFDEVRVHNPKNARRTTSNGEKTSGTNFRKALHAGDEKTIKEHLGAAYSEYLSKHLQAGAKAGKIDINR